MLGRYETRPGSENRFASLDGPGRESAMGRPSVAEIEFRSHWNSEKWDGVMEARSKQEGASLGMENKNSDQTVKRILIVEDEATLAFFLARSLMSEAEDYEVLTSRDGESAIAKMEEKPFDVVISDIVLPQMDGFSVLRQTRKQWPESKVILMTAYGSPEIKARAQKMGAFAYIEKPFVYDRMRELVFRALQEAKASSAT
jgi:CheY-like chemotaxis protein